MSGLGHMFSLLGTDAHRRARRRRSRDARTVDCERNKAELASAGMRPLLMTFFMIAMAALGAATVYWRPAGFGFVLVIPLALLGIQNVSKKHLSVRSIFVITAVSAVVLIAAAASMWPPAAWATVVVVPFTALGLADMIQTSHSIRRNFPVLGHMRYLLEGIRPEIQQYFIEQNQEGRPFARESRSLVYQRAKGVRDTVPFGTQLNVYETGYEWVNHSIRAHPPRHDTPTVRFGEATCKHPYDASLLNISAMSFGSLGPQAIEALNRGAKAGGFAHNTGEGSISDYHRSGGDLIWQIGTGYFGCRTADGRFDPDQFVERAAYPEVKMIEVKLSQGAKPGHGGILPGAKITPEIARIRGVSMGRDVISPPSHTAFSTPTELVTFMTRLRELSGGKPVGFKLCVGKQREFFGIVKAMIETGQHPDFIAVDGGEGGTGAAPVEFSNYLGSPLVDGLVFVHNALVGSGLRDKVRLIASGKVATGFGLVRLLAIGADVTYSARAMMLALGCIQARLCNSNECPVGVATQDPSLTVGLNVADKTPRVTRFHAQTVEAALELVAAAGLEQPSDLRRWHIHRRISSHEVRHYGELYPYLEPQALLSDPASTPYARAWNSARADSFDEPKDATRC